MLHRHIACTSDINFLERFGIAQMKAGDDANLALCMMLNGTNKISL